MGVGHWLLNFFGISNLSGYGYGFFSGIGSDLGEVALIGAIIAVYRKHNCPRTGLLAHQPASRRRDALGRVPQAPPSDQQGADRRPDRRRSSPGAATSTITCRIDRLLIRKPRSARSARVRAGPHSNAVNSSD